MKKRVFGVMAVGAGLGAIALSAASGAQAASSSSASSVTVPPVCVTEPLPLFPGAQLQVGYCPSGPNSGVG